MDLYQFVGNGVPNIEDGVNQKYVQTKNLSANQQRLSSSAGFSFHTCSYSVEEKCIKGVPKESQSLGKMSSDEFFILLVNKKDEDDEFCVMCALDEYEKAKTKKIMTKLDFIDRAKQAFSAIGLNCQNCANGPANPEFSSENKENVPSQPNHVPKNRDTIFPPYIPLPKSNNSGYLSNLENPNDNPKIFKPQTSYSKFQGPSDNFANSGIRIPNYPNRGPNRSMDSHVKDNLLHPNEVSVKRPKYTTIWGQSLSSASNFDFQNVPNYLANNSTGFDFSNIVTNDQYQNVGTSSNGTYNFGVNPNYSRASFLKARNDLVAARSIMKETADITCDFACLGRKIVGKKY